MTRPALPLLLTGLATLTTLALSPPAFAQRAPALTGALRLTDVHVGEAYTDHPLVRSVKNQGYLELLDRDKVLDKRFSADRAWGLVDALGAEAVTRHAVDGFVTQGVVARLSIGQSGALQARDIRVDQLDARQALVLGWLRALAAGEDSKRLLKRSAKVQEAGALQLLEVAAKLAPEVQAAQLAHLLVLAATRQNRDQSCKDAAALAKAARDGGRESVRLAAAERVDALAKVLGKGCAKGELTAYAGPISLAPPLSEAPVAGARAPVKAAISMLSAPGEPFVAVAPVFKGWLGDAGVKAVASGTRLDQTLLDEAMKRDNTGDTAVALLNATYLLGHQPVEAIVQIAWATMAMRHGFVANLDGVVMGLAQLTPQEAMVLGYSRTLQPISAHAPDDPSNARPISASALLAAAKGKLPSAAALGPILALGHQIDVDRTIDPCKPVDLADALRGVVQRSSLPEVSKTALGQALDMVQAPCKTAAPGRAKP